MPIFEAVKTFPRPRGICQHCQEHGAAIPHRSGRWFLYCEHNQTAGVLEPQEYGSKRWQLHTPVSREDFTEQMLAYADAYSLANGAGFVGNA